MAKRFLTLAQIASTIPGARGAEQLSPATLTRWILAGCPARDGKRIKLPATRAGVRWLVREEDLDAFFAALRGEIDAPPQPVTKSESESRKAIERANRELEKAGC